MKKRRVPLLPEYQLDRLLVKWDQTPHQMKPTRKKFMYGIQDKKSLKTSFYLPQYNSYKANIVPSNRRQPPEY